MLKNEHSGGAVASAGFAQYLSAALAAGAVTAIKLIKKITRNAGILGPSSARRS
jgi:hypothetical protein